MLFLIFITLILSLDQNDANLFNLIYDTPRFEKTADLTQIPNGFLMATIPANTLIYRIEINDSSEKGHKWFCLEPSMCLGVGYSREFRVYKTKEPIRVMSQTGRATVLHGVENYFFEGNFGPGNEGKFPQLFCDMNDQQGRLKIHGMARFVFFWELVLCRTERYLELVSKVPIKFTYPLFKPLQHFIHAYEKVLQFDWTSLTLLKPNLKPRPSETILDLSSDHWQPSSSELKIFKQKVFTIWNQYYENGIKSIDEYSAIHQLETSVESIIARFSPILINRKDEKIKEIILFQLQLFGNDSSSALDQCLKYQIPDSEYYVSDSRKEGYLSIKSAIQNVLSHICQIMIPLSFNDLFKKEIQSVLDKLAFNLHWSILEKCDGCDFEQCMVGMSFLGSTKDQIPLNVCMRDIKFPYELVPKLLIQK